MTEEFDWKTFIITLQDAAKQGIKFQKEAIDFLKIAKDDLETSKILLEKQKYAMSTYHLQQAVEKCIKSYYIITGRKEPIQVYGHDFNIAMMKKEINNAFLPNIKKAMSNISDDEVKKSIEKVSLNTDSIQNLEEKEEIVRKLNEAEIDSLLKLNDILKEKFSEPSFINKIESDLQKPSMINKIKHIITSVFRIRISDKVVSERITTKEVNEEIKHFAEGMNLLLLGIITYCHSNTPRYPNYRPGMSYFDYNEQLGIIKRLKILQDKTNEAYGFVERLCQKSRTTSPSTPLVPRQGLILE